MVRLFLAIAFVASCLAGCAPFPPVRQAGAEPPPGCGEVFDGARPAQRIREAHLSLGKPVAAEQPVDYHSPCWDASHEYTADYDVFFVEFDDHGWLAAPGGDPGRMKWLMRQLDVLVEKNGGTPLNLIVYTHGWHHSAAAERMYPTGLPARDELGAQLPILIILQSEGDMATGTFFTAFRRFTTIFNAGRGRAQSQANLHTVGWTDRYVTHRLETVPGFDPEHQCQLDCQLDTERAWRTEQKAARYAGFGQPRLALGNGLMLKQCGVDGHGKLACDGGGAPVSDGEGLAHPPFMPIWVVKTDPAIIRDHNDFLNARLVTFIRNMYYTVLEQSRASP
jgi:hypothetical protein